MNRVIQLPCGRNVTLGEYVRSWRVLRSLPPRKPVANWGHFPEEAGDILRAISFGVQDRINRHLAYYGKGRKWGDTWQNDTARASRDVNTPRLAVHWVPAHLRARLADRLAETA